MCYLNSIRKSWLTVLRFPTHLDSLASVRCIRDGLFLARHTPHTVHGRHPILFLFLFSVNRALAGYKHIEIAWKGQSTVIFSKRRKISTIWTDPCVIRPSRRALLLLEQVALGFCAWATGPWHEKINIEKIYWRRHQPDSNRRGQSPPDFESGALTTRPWCRSPGKRTRGLRATYVATWAFWPCGRAGTINTKTPPHFHIWTHNPNKHYGFAV